MRNAFKFSKCKNVVNCYLDFLTLAIPSADFVVHMVLFVSFDTCNKVALVNYYKSYFL